MRPLVSVIVPCYNCESSVTKTLDSLYHQTLKDIEVIAINDGSKDYTLEVLKGYQASHPDFDLHVYSKENEGIAETRNFGLAKVTGTYFGFLDSDDYTTAEMYQEMSDLAVQEDLQLVVSDFIWVNSKGERLQKEGPYETGPAMMVNLFAVLWNKLYKTDFIRSLDLSFPKGNRYEDDCFLYCLTMHVTKIGFTNKPYVHYVQHEASITHDNGTQVKNMIRVFEIIVDYYKAHGQYAAYKDALEYIHIKAFLGNSLLRSIQIEDKNDRNQTIQMGWKLLNKEFPNWHRNPYLKSMGGLKNLYFSMVYDWNLPIVVWLLRTFKKDNL